MTWIWARKALLPTGWADDVGIAVKDGRIESVMVGAPREGYEVQGYDVRGYEVGLLLPAPVNVHSHAFQRAMAGLTETRGPDPSDSFWSWRRLMFRFLDQLTPDHVEAIAAFVQMEMLEAGYASQAEFHYLHHQADGAPYDNLAEMSERIASAAQQTGIGLCLLPVHYEFGGCDGRQLSAGQIRFGNNLERFCKLYEGAVRAVTSLSGDSTVGVAPHSLRAVAQADLRRLPDLFPAGPIHIHIAEQIAEVQEVQAAWRARPVEWALANLPLDERWCLIHCTQMTSEETTQLAQTHVTAGLCPITESNLGDGIFNGMMWARAGGHLAIGSDSNIRISLSEELRTLDYSQRLRDKSRAAFATPEQSTGRRLFSAIVDGGARATGRQSGRIEPGYFADLLALDETSIHSQGRQDDIALDGWIFAGDDHMVRDVWSAGRHVVQEGQHRHHDEITARYRAIIGTLKTEI